MVPVQSTRPPGRTGQERTVRSNTLSSISSHRLPCEPVWCQTAADGRTLTLSQRDRTIRTVTQAPHALVRSRTRSGAIGSSRCLTGVEMPNPRLPNPVRRDPRKGRSFRTYRLLRLPTCNKTAWICRHDRLPKYPRSSGPGNLRHSAGGIPASDGVSRMRPPPPANHPGRGLTHCPPIRPRHRRPCSHILGPTIHARRFLRRAGRGPGSWVVQEIGARLIRRETGCV